MKKIFTGYGIDIDEDAGKFFLTYDEGELIIKYITIEISEEDANEARKSSHDAYKVILKYQNLEKNKNSLTSTIEKI